MDCVGQLETRQILGPVLYVVDRGLCGHILAHTSSGRLFGSNRRKLCCARFVTVNRPHRPEGFHLAREGRLASKFPDSGCTILIAEASKPANSSPLMNAPRPY
jgi:hypothetical protein